MRLQERRITSLLSEVVVILVGVLAALWVDSMWQNRSDRAREGEYLEQLMSDSRENLGRLAASIDLERRHMGVAATLAAALEAPSRTPVDSVRAWLEQRDGSWWYSDPRLLDGTITALVETGDLTLIRDSHLRSAVLGYQSQLNADMAEFRRFVQWGLEAQRHLNIRGALGVSPAIAPNEALEVRWIVAMHGDAEGTVAARALHKAYESRIWYLDQMSHTTETLIAGLEAATAR
jgi:hypothetical protein